MKITRISMITGITRTKEIDVTPEQLKRWNEGKGELIQKAMPNITDDERDFILTGTTEDEWEKAFEDDERIDCSKM